MPASHKPAVSVSTLVLQVKDGQFQPVKVGTSPAGVEWVAYHAKDIRPLADRLQLLWARHDDL